MVWEKEHWKFICSERLQHNCSLFVTWLSLETGKVSPIAKYDCLVILSWFNETSTLLGANILLFPVGGICDRCLEGNPPKLPQVQRDEYKCHQATLPFWPPLVPHPGVSIPCLRQRCRSQGHGGRVKAQGRLPELVMVRRHSMPNLPGWKLRPSLKKVCCDLCIYTPED